MFPTMMPKSQKIGPWGAQGRFIHRFYRFWTVSKNRSFFDGVLGRPKIEKKSSLGASKGGKVAPAIRRGGRK